MLHNSFKGLGVGHSTVSIRSRQFLVLDAAMNDLQRPSLYDAWQDIVPVRDDPSRAMATYDIVGRYAKPAIPSRVHASCPNARRATC